MLLVSTNAYRFPSHGSRNLGCCIMLGPKVTPLHAREQRISPATPPPDSPKIFAVRCSSRRSAPSVNSPDSHWPHSSGTGCANRHRPYRHLLPTLLRFSAIPYSVRIMPTHPIMPSGEDSTARASSEYEEKHGLLEGVVSGPLAGASPRLRWAVIFLALSNAVSLFALFYAAVRPQNVPTTVVYPPQPDWFPPQKGRGWVHMLNKTALPDMPGLNQSLPEHIALPSVYHQLHCLYSTMRSYYDVLDYINNPHRGARELPTDPVWNKEHLNHCWDYLRQNIMCAADVTLEWHRWNEKVETGWGYEHQCKDWDALTEWVLERRTSNNWGLLRGEGERIPLKEGS
ncbi:hypothetical protein CTA1_11000 [Colletotrichum tanaceti]|uniref:Oxidase ustYa n=1 Tax=Colletotrichum tanaceti TaxID=1306861 RepID=A0A4U6XB39_9PEZI|nr:hypothetical protein CTA1_11000 [Colletotrichum tanaceti]